MNELIQTLFKDFSVDGKSIPVRWLYYKDHANTYVTYQQTDADASYSGDDQLLGYVDYYDFDVYSKGNYTKVIQKIREILEKNDFVWEPSRTSADMYETETGLYHKTLCFAYLRQEENK